jgi:uncharacterized membrane protein
MEGLVFLLVLLALVCVLTGPAALIVAIVAMKRIGALQREMRAAASRQAQKLAEAIPVIARETTKPVEPAIPVQPSVMRVEAARVPAAGPGLEQRIGTQWVLIAGVVTVMFAVGFFLKYAYDQRWIGPWGRVLIATAAGLVALVIGEVTRRRGYDIAAKGMTALGFAILYAAIFAAHRWYGLIRPATAYVLAVGITAGAMTYAVALDEIIVAMLSLVGGFLTPAVLSTGQNLPTLLFSYVLILSAGAMFCAYWRRWIAVNVLVFAGTYLLYTGWFERFYRPEMRAESPPAQLGVALFWLGVFFVIYLVLPILHGLVRRVKSSIQDVVLVLANAAVVFYYLWTILHEYREALALCSVGLGAAHLLLAGVVLVRCREDSGLWRCLLLAALVFATLAVPLYFEAHAVAILWAVEGLLLTAAGVRYRSGLARLAGGSALALAVADLVAELPLHAGSFRLFFNPALGTWAFVAAALLAAHVLYRVSRTLDAQMSGTMTQVLYAAGLLTLMTALSMELWLNYLNIKGQQPDMAFFAPQTTLVLALFVLLFTVWPLRPRGLVCPVIGVILGAAGSIFVLVTYSYFHRAGFTLFANLDFVRASFLVIALFLAAGLLRRGASPEPERIMATVLSLAAVLLLWVLMTEEVWLYYRRSPRVERWEFLAQMYISVLWAAYATVLMVVGFWRRVRMLRYIALGIFVLLLAKIFLVDTRELEVAYRIAGFLATGLALVGISYLYQYLKKTGFFEPARPQRNSTDRERHDA